MMDFLKHKLYHDISPIKHLQIHYISNYTNTQELVYTHKM